MQQASVAKFGPDMETPMTEQSRESTFGAESLVLSLYSPTLSLRATKVSKCLWALISYWQNRNHSNSHTPMAVVVIT